MVDRSLDWYIREVYEMVKVFSLDQFVELHNRSFLDERPLSTKDFSGNLKEQDEKAEYISQIGFFDKEEIKRIYNVANQILSRK